MPKKYEDWLGLQRTAKIPAVLALCGDERALLEEALQWTRTGYNVDKLSLKSNTLDDIIGQANTVPMFSSKRFIEVLDAEDLKADAVGPLESYLKNPSPSAQLVFVMPKYEGTKKLFKLLDQAGVLYEFNHTTEAQMGWILVERANKHGLIFEPGAVDMMVLAIGNELMMAERAFEKLRLVIGERPISVADIETHVADTRLEDAFLLGRAFVMGDKPKMLALLCQLQAQREAPIKLVGLLAWQLRIVMKARILLDAGDREREIGEQLKLFGDRLKSTLQAAKKSSYETHAKRLKVLKDLDETLKTSYGSDWLNFEKMVMEQC